MTTPQRWFTLDIDCGGQLFAAGRPGPPIVTALHAVIDRRLTLGISFGTVPGSDGSTIGVFFLHSDCDDPPVSRVPRGKRHFSVYINLDGERFEQSYGAALLTLIIEDLGKIAGNVATHRTSGALGIDQGNWKKLVYGNWLLQWSKDEKP